MSAPSPNAFSGRDLAGATLVVLVWGLNFVVIKHGLRDFTPFQLGAARFLFSFFPLMLWIRPPPIPLRWLAAYGLLQGIGQFGLLFFALKVGMTAALSPVMMQMQLFVTALLGAALLGEHVTAWQWAGTALVMSALVFVLRNSPARR